MATDPHASDAATRPEFFVDEELLDYVYAVYGSAMADRVGEMFKFDPFSETGFVRSVRRSLTQEIERKAVNADA